MSFRKRNLIINRGPPGSSPTATAATPPASPPAPKALPRGVRPSPINGQYTTSTGTPSLDSLLAGHAGLPLGCSLLIEEPGTTDFGGALLRYYAAEGIAQGHAVTLVGVGAGWVRDLPAVVGDTEGEGNGVGGGGPKERERMKIAWRYERLGEFGSGIGGSRAQSFTKQDPGAAPNTAPTTPLAFCHSFDLTKRLTIPSDAKLSFVPLPPEPLTSASTASASTSPFASVITTLADLINKHPPTHPHRIVIPTLLSPLVYPSSSSTPTNLLPFIHSLRTLLRRHPQKLTIMMSLPLELYPRDTALVRWVEILSDSVLELTPLPHLQQHKGVADQTPQGLVKIWKLPVIGERGGGVGVRGGGEDLAYTVTRKRFEIQAYCLPPMDEDGEGEGGGGGKGEGRATKVDIEF